MRGLRGRATAIGALLAAGVALILLGAYLRGRGLEDADRIASVAGLFLNIAAVAIGLSGVWRDRRPAAEATGDVGAVLDSLADAVRREWRDEENVRRVHDPFPLAVRVVPADDWLQDHDENIGGGPFPAATELSGIAALYAGVPTGRLVVLGRAGAGKSVLLIRLVLDLIEARRQPRDPVPVLLPIAAWDPAEKPLHRWIADQVRRTGYPSLRGLDCRDLLRDGLLIPVLDGFDELRDAERATALRAINFALGPGTPLVLTSRIDEYAAAVTAEDVLTGTLVRRLDDLTPDEVHRYLPLATRKPATGGPGKWDAVLAELSSDPELPLSRALTTPLMVSLARESYSETDADPAVLLDRTRYPEPVRIQEHLLDAYIASVYSRPGRLGITTERARDALEALATRAYDLESDGFGWWNTHLIAPRRSFTLFTSTAGVLAGALAGRVAGTNSSVTDLLVGMSLGALAGGTVGLSSIAARPRQLPRRLRAAGARIGSLFLKIFPTALVIIIGATWTTTDAGLVEIVGAFWAGGLLWLLASLSLGLGYVWLAFESPGPAPIGATPRSVLSADRAACLTLVGGGAVAWIAFSVWAGGNTPPRIAAASIFVVLGLTIGHAWPKFVAVRGYFLITGAFPWRTMAFLEDAHQRGLLRQGGASYRFRHILLRDRLIARAVAAQQPPRWAEVTIPERPSPWSRLWQPVFLGLQYHLRLIHRTAYLFYLANAWSDLGYADRAVRTITAEIDLNEMDSYRGRSASRHNLGEYLEQAGRLDEANRTVAAVLDGRRQRLGEDDPSTLSTTVLYASFLITWGRPAKARDLLHGVLDQFMRLHGPHHERTLHARLLTLLAAEPRDLSTAGEFEQLIAAHRALPRTDPVGLADIQTALATLHRRTGRSAEAEKLLVEAARNLRRARGAGHPSTLAVRAMLVRTRHHLGAPADACAREMHAIRRRLERRLGPGHPDVRAAETYAAHLAAIA